MQENSESVGSSVGYLRLGEKRVTVCSGWWR